jgi:hypothetical protein
MKPSGRTVGERDSQSASLRNEGAATPPLQSSGSKESKEEVVPQAGERTSIAIVAGVLAVIVGIGMCFLLSRTSSLWDTKLASRTSIPIVIGGTMPPGYLTQIWPMASNAGFSQAYAEAHPEVVPCVIPPGCLKIWVTGVPVLEQVEFQKVLVSHGVLSVTIAWWGPKWNLTVGFFVGSATV